MNVPIRTTAILAILSIAIACSALSAVAALRYKSAAQFAEAQRDALGAEMSTAATNDAILASLVRREASITEALAQEQQSRAIRDLVYRTNVIGSSDNPARSGEIFVHLGEPGYEQLCGGMSDAYAWALRQIGVPARVVQLASQRFLDGENRFDTHVTVEVLIDGKWRVSDPTFNAEFQCSGNYEFLDIEGMRACVNGGNALVRSKAPLLFQGEH